LHPQLSSSFGALSGAKGDWGEEGQEGVRGRSRGSSTPHSLPALLNCLYSAEEWDLTSEDIKIRVAKSALSAGLVAKLDLGYVHVKKLQWLLCLSHRLLVFPKILHLSLLYDTVSPLCNFQGFYGNVTHCSDRLPRPPDTARHAPSGPQNTEHTSWAKRNRAR